MLLILSKVRCLLPFMHPFSDLCVEKLLVEIKIAIDRWCRVERHQAGQSSGMLSASSTSSGNSIGSGSSPRIRPKTGSSEQLKAAVANQQQTAVTNNKRSSGSMSVAESEIFPMLASSVDAGDQFVRRPSMSSLARPAPPLPAALFSTPPTASFATASKPAVTLTDSREPKPKATIFVQDLQANMHRMHKSVPLPPPVPQLLAVTSGHKSAPPALHALNCGSASLEVFPPPAAPATAVALHEPSSANSSAPVEPKNNSFRAKERTWVYHVLLDVVQRTQRDHAVSITVFI